MTLDATYDPSGLHFHLADPLVTRRVQASALGLVEENCLSLPFGNGENCIVPPTAPTTADDATEHHFTSKERDTESGNDYFMARYYSSSMGRFMSPDWSAKATPVPYARLDNPQSLNLYAYLMNNPLGGVDADGHCPPDAPNCEKLPNNPAAQVSPATKEAIKASVNASDKPNAAVGDKKGGSHEEGGETFHSNGKEVVSPAEPGPAHDLTNPTPATMDVNKAADPAKQKPDDVKADDQWHVHPSATGFAVMGGQLTPVGFNEGPSPGDIQNASPAPTLNIEVSARTGLVSFYTTEGTTCTESSKEFYKPQ